MGKKMRRCCNGLLTAFRVIQFILTLVVLGFGAYITYEFYSLASSAHDLSDAITQLQNDTQRRKLEQLPVVRDLNLNDKDIKGFADTLNTVLGPILRYFQSSPTRAIVITVVGLWSFALIIYLYVAHRSTKNPSMNKRWIRVLLEIFTLLAWIACLVCAILLALQYGILALAGGAETKIAFDFLKPILKEVLLNTLKSPNFERALDIIDPLVTIGILAVITSVAALVCLMVSLVSAIVACCTSGKSNKMTATPGSEATQAFLPTSPQKQREKEKLSGHTVTEVDSPASWQAVNQYASPTSGSFPYQNQPNTIGYQSVPTYPPSQVQQMTTDIHNQPSNTYYQSHPHPTMYQHQPYPTAYYGQQNPNGYHEPHLPNTYHGELKTAAYQQQQHTHTSSVNKMHPDTNQKQQALLTASVTQKDFGAQQEQQPVTRSLNPQSPTRHNDRPSHTAYYEPPPSASYYQQSFPNAYDRSLPALPSDVEDQPPLPPPKPNPRRSVPRKPVRTSGARNSDGYQSLSPTTYQSPKSYPGYHAY